MQAVTDPLFRGEPRISANGQVVLLLKLNVILYFVESSAKNYHTWLPSKKGSRIDNKAKHTDFHLFSDRNSHLLALSGVVVKTEGIVKAQ